MRKCNYHPFIDSYIDGCRDGSIVVNEDILLACDLVEHKLNNPDVIINHEKIAKAVELIERYFEMELFDWELFIIALIHCYYKFNDTVVFDEFVIIMGRGNGKNGFISGIAWYLTTQYHGIRDYHVDIVANSEDQAKTSFFDIYEMLTRTWAKSKKFFYKTKEIIKNLKTNSQIKFNTSNAKTKDGKRTGCLIADELHEYENYDTLNRFTSGFGKKKHSRIFKISTNGDVREGVYDEEVRIGEDILNGTIKDTGTLPLFYRLKDEKDVFDKNKWNMSNPSLKYLDVLLQRITKEFNEMQYKPSMEKEFYTKRMNLSRTKEEIPVTEWKNIEATNKPIPDVHGLTATVGTDYVKVTDFASVNIHFRIGDNRIDLNHSWLCLKSADIPRLKIPWKQWAEEDHLTLVDDVEISPDLIAEYIAEQAQYYNITKLALDNYRYALLAEALKRVGFDAKERKNVYLVRPSDIMKVVPVIDSCFVNQYFIWGDQPLLRWATNNTKLIASGKKQGTDTGNFYYGKIEAKSRKTDPFMALVHSMCIEDELGTGESSFYDLPVIT